MTGTTARTDRLLGTKKFVRRIEVTRLPVTRGAYRNGSALIFLPFCSGNDVVMPSEFPDLQIFVGEDPSVLLLKKRNENENDTKLASRARQPLS